MQVRMLKRRITLQPRMLTQEEAAEYCGVSVKAFKRACPVVATVIGESAIRRYDIRKLDEWLDRLGQSTELELRTLPEEMNWLERLSESMPKTQSRRRRLAG
jgi:hypothetical protein